MNANEVVKALIEEARAKFLRACDKRDAAKAAPGGIVISEADKLRALIAKFGCQADNVRGIVEILWGDSLPPLPVAPPKALPAGIARLRLGIGKNTGRPGVGVICIGLGDGTSYSVNGRFTTYRHDVRLPAREDGLAFLTRLETDPNFVRILNAVPFCTLFPSPVTK